MPRTYVNRLLLTTIYRDLCSATEDHPVAQVDRAPRRRKGNANPIPRRDLKRQLCFFPEKSFVGERDGFMLFTMPDGTTHEGWRLAVPCNRVDKMWKGPVRRLYGGYVVRYPTSHYAYPIVSGGEQSIIETDDIQTELLLALYHEMLPNDSVAHWVRVGKGRIIRVKAHGLHSEQRRTTICGRIVMRDYWNDQYFTSGVGYDHSRVFLRDFHATTMCRITAILKNEIRDMATDGSRKAMARARNTGTDWYTCGCGYYGPAEPKCEFKYSGFRHPVFTVTCPKCGRDCTPDSFHEMNQSMRDYARAYADSDYQPFSRETPRYTILRPRGEIDEQKR